MLPAICLQHLCGNEAEEITFDDILSPMANVSTNAPMAYLSSVKMATNEYRIYRRVISDFAETRDFDDAIFDWP